MDGRRRFRPPWRAEDRNGSCWVVVDATGSALAYFYYSDRQGADTVGNPLTRREAYALAANFAKLPALLGRA